MHDTICHSMTKPVTKYIFLAIPISTSESENITETTTPEIVSSEPTPTEVTEKTSEPPITIISSESPISTTPKFDELLTEENDLFDDNPFEYEEKTEAQPKKKG